MIYKNTRNTPARLKVAGRTVLISPFHTIELAEDVEVPGFIKKSPSPKPKKEKATKGFFKKSKAPKTPEVEQAPTTPTNSDKE